MAGKSGTRKYGRKKSKPAQQRYTNERRWEVNKIRKVQKIVNKFLKSIKVKIDNDWKEIKPK